MPTVAGKVLPGGAFKVVDADDIDGTVTVKTTFVFIVPGTLTTGHGKVNIPVPCALTAASLQAYVKIVPTGADLTMNVNYDGSDITAAVLTIAATANWATEKTAFAVSSYAGPAAGTYKLMKLDIEQVGSTIAGADLTVVLVCTQTATLTGP